MAMQTQTAVQTQTISNTKMGIATAALFAASAMAVAALPPDIRVTEAGLEKQIVVADGRDVQTFRAVVNTAPENITRVDILPNYPPSVCAANNPARGYFIWCPYCWGHANFWSHTATWGCPEGETYYGSQHVTLRSGTIQPDGRGNTVITVTWTANPGSGPINVSDVRFIIEDGYNRQHTLRGDYGRIGSGFEIVTTRPTPTATGGACLVIADNTVIPPLLGPDTDRGYVKMVKPGINTIDGLRSACSQADYNELLQRYCNINIGPVQKIVATYGSDGTPLQSGQSASGAGYTSCPPRPTATQTPLTASSNMTFFVTSRGNGANGGSYGGLIGADRFCNELAANSTAPGAGNRRWVAFLSAGNPETHAIDRIGAGPWSNYYGYPFFDIVELYGLGQQQIVDELGNTVPYQGVNADHDIVTGSDITGRLARDGWGNPWTCRDALGRDWMSNSDNAQTSVGHSDWDISDDTNRPDGADHWMYAHMSECSADLMRTHLGSGRLYCFVTHSYRGIPTVDQIPVTNRLAGSAELYRFRVNANGNDIGLYKATAQVTASNVTLMSLQLVDTSDGRVLYDSGYDPRLLASGLHTFDLLFDPYLMGTTSGGSEIVIGRGQNRVFSIRGIFTGVNSASVVSTRLLGDSSPSAGSPLATAVGVDRGAEDDFIWSDRSSSAHSTSTADWVNGYLVPGVPGTDTGMPTTIAP